MQYALQPGRETGEYLPCRYSGMMLPEDWGHHKMVCRNGGITGAHHHVEEVLVSVTRLAHIPGPNLKAIVPTRVDSKHQGDILITLSPANRPYVLDFSVHHPHTVLGECKMNALPEALKVHSQQPWTGM